MDSYQPYLLPLLPPFQGKDLPFQPACPLDEEALLRRGHKQPDWSGLRREVRRHYGLELLIHKGENWTVSPSPGETGSHSSWRCLIIESPDAAWFLMEHPAALSAFDRERQTELRPCLARPSLFSQLCASSHGNPAQGSLKEPQPSSPTDNHQALDGWLHRLLGPDRPSDWHLEPHPGGYASRLRIDGRMAPARQLDRDTGQWILNSCKARGGKEKNPPGEPVEGKFRFSDSEGGFISSRFSLIPSIHGDALVVRFLYPPSAWEYQLEALGFREEQVLQLRNQFHAGEGLWLVCGPTGSGKSTTLHALLQLSVRANEKILSVEDPVEQAIPGVQQVEVGCPPGLTFALALRAFLRQSPDCLLVGEIRDAETASVALQAARSGHRVLSSLHARSTSGVRRRFEDLEQPPENLQSVCRLLVHQRLSPRLCAACRREAPPTPVQAGLLARLQRSLPRTLASSPGCEYCHGGTRGRMVVSSLESLNHRQATREGLLQASLDQVLKGQTAVNSLWNFLPGDLQKQFQLCQL